VEVWGDALVHAIERVSVHARSTLGNGASGSMTLDFYDAVNV
jgi:hypothetical protein